MGFFENLGINSDYVILVELVIILILLILVCSLFVRTKRIYKRFDALTHGQKGKDLEEVIVSSFADMDKIRKNDNKRSREYQEIKEQIYSCYHKMGLVKYDAFNQMSGNLSFSLALLNDENDGILLNCMHSREGCFLYAKEIINGQSYVALSEEEKDALSQAAAVGNILA